jgi:hypothetical protein
MADRDRDNDKSQQQDRSEHKESEQSGRFQDRVEKLERPDEWPDPPDEKE